MSPFKNLSLSAKLIAPAFCSCALIVGAMDYLISNASQDLMNQRIKAQAFEYIESFLMATEVTGDKANIIRVTNSLGTYSDIKEIFIIDNKQLNIIASNKNRFNGKELEKLPDYYNMDDVSSIVHSDERLYTQLPDNRYLVSYRANIFSGDHTSQQSITILMLLSPDSINTFFSTFKNQVFAQSAVLFLLALALFFILLKMVLLTPIKKIIAVLSKEQVSGKPILCDITSGDELGTLATTYNSMILDRHNKRQALIAANKELEQLSQHDALTGISNRRNFDNVLQKEWLRAIRKNDMISLIMVDIDNFKQFNDIHGHLAGDDCLKIVAATLNNCAKRPGDLVSRYGGEEFAIILPHSSDSCWQFAENCRCKIEQLIAFHDDNAKPVKVTISMGLASTIPAKGQTPEVLIKAADMALYKAKASGRNMVVVHDLNKDITDREFKLGNVIPLKKQK